MVEVRIAQAGDAGGIGAIYAPFILRSAFSFETQVPSAEQIQKRIETCLLRFPWLVCQVDGLLAGYIYASPHREREAYQWTCESSVYIHDDFQGKGLGRELYSVLLRFLQQQGLRNVYAGITLPNDPSVRLHEKCGFIRFASYDHVGYKLNRWHEVGWWKLRLNEYDPEPSPPLKFSQLDSRFVEEQFRAAAQKIRSKLSI